MFNLLIGGAAGQGVETLAALLEKLLKRHGFEIFTIKDYMSRVRGGHNFVQIRFDADPLFSHDTEIDAIIALDSITVKEHRAGLKKNGYIIVDSGEEIEDDNAILVDLKNIAKKIGNPRVFTTVAAGVFTAMHGLDEKLLFELLEDAFTGDILEKNIQAAKEGFGISKETKPLKYPGKRKKMLITGNEAVALGAIAAGVKFYSAYPMTPSTGIMNYLASKMNEVGIVVEQAEDEIAAINMAIGASFAGARSMTGTSGGGFCLMTEGLGLSAMMEVPLVIANVQRPGPVTGFPTRTEQGDLKFVISASHGEFPRMVISPRTAEEAFYETVRAFNIADDYRIPVIILSDQFLADTAITTVPFDMHRVESNISRTRAIIPGEDPEKVVLADSDEHDEYGRITESAEIRNKMVEKRLEKFNKLKSEVKEPVFIGDEDSHILLVGFGSTYGPIKDALKMLNKADDKKYGALIYSDVWPFPVKLLKEKAEKAEKVINVEQNSTGQLGSLMAECAGIKPGSSVLCYDGRPMCGRYIYEKLKGAK